MIDAKIVGERIAKFRKERGLTQTLLAEKLSVSPKTISKWEKGHGLPDVEILPDIAKFFNTTIDMLLTGIYTKPKELEVCTQISTTGERTQWNFPAIEDFPEELRDGILLHFLTEYARTNNIEVKKFIEGITLFNKPSTNEIAVARLMSLEQVSIARVQKNLCIGFSKGARIIDLLEEKKLIERKNTSFFEWVKKDEDVIREIIREVYNN